MDAGLGKPYFLPIAIGTYASVAWLTVQISQSILDPKWSDFYKILPYRQYVFCANCRKLHPIIIGFAYGYENVALQANLIIYRTTMDKNKQNDI
ncbi:MAG: hypothetical protein PHO94_13680 [Petrimonas sp.]|nr:hypothetical protein [Petrimonas sp.]